MNGPCHNRCSKLPQSVRMYVQERDVAGVKRKIPIYLCPRCAEKLGYVKVVGQGLGLGVG